MNSYLLIFILLFVALTVPILIWGYKHMETIKIKDVVFACIIIVWLLALIFGINWSIASTIPEQGALINTIMIIVMALVTTVQYNCKKFKDWLNTDIYIKK